MPHVGRRSNAPEQHPLKPGMPGRKHHLPRNVLTYICNETAALLTPLSRRSETRDQEANIISIGSTCDVTGAPLCNSSSMAATSMEWHLHGSQQVAHLVCCHRQTLIAFYQLVVDLHQHLHMHKVKFMDEGRVQNADIASRGSQLGAYIRSTGCSICYAMGYRSMRWNIELCGNFRKTIAAAVETGRQKVGAPLAFSHSASVASRSDTVIFRPSARTSSRCL